MAQCEISPGLSSLSEQLSRASTSTVWIALNTLGDTLGASMVQEALSWKGGAGVTVL